MTATLNKDLKQDILAAFARYGHKKIDPDVLGQCVALVMTLQLEPDRVAECWDAVSMTHNLSSLNGHSWKTLRTALIKLTDDNDVVPPVTSSSDTVVQVKRKAVSSPTQSSSSSSSKQQAVVTPASKQTTVASVTSSATSSSSSNGNRRISLSPKLPRTLIKMEDGARKKVKYEERQGVGTVVATYEPETLPPSRMATPAPEPRCRIAWKDNAAAAADDVTLSLNIQKPYRHFFTTLPETAQALDKRLTDMTTLFQQEHAFGTGDLAALEAVGVPRQDLVCCTGRICSSAHEGRMNATTVMLEGSRATAGGSRVEVDLRHLKQDYSLFPGQIVTMEGHNTTGRSLVVQRLCEGVPHPPNTSKAGELFNYHYTVQDGMPLNIVTAAGPFTTADNLDYQPLLDLLHNMLQQEPDVVILTGPFVDMRHVDVAAGNTTVDGAVVPFEVLFAHKVSQILEDVYESAKHATQFILQPSLDDATAEWVFPQPPMQDRLPKPQGSNLPGGDDFELGTLGLSYVENIKRGESSDYRRVHCVPNPCTLRINEVVIGITSADVLFQISINETNGHLPAGSRLARIAQHLLQQRSYYPLFPAAINLDWRQSWDMPCRPDLLICPSKLSPLCKAVLDSTLVVNPGPLSRDTTGGTYAILQVHPLPHETLERTDPQVDLPHNVAQRTRVEVKRI